MKEFANSPDGIREAVVRALRLAQQDSMRHFFHRRIMVQPPGSRILFLGAHPDDIEIGAGGAVVRYHDARADVRFVCLTDGRRAAPEAAGEEAMARTRAEEAREVARFLGVPEPLLFGLNEHEFIAPQHREALVEAVRGALEEHAPDTVYLPFFHDQHPDHRYLSVLLAGALDRTSLRPRILQYEIMCFVPPGLVLDISDALARKQDLIRRYRSQVEILDYPTFSGAVAVAHASLVGPHCHAAEAYCPLTAEEFLQRTAGLLLDAPGELSGQVLLTPPEGAAP